MIKCIIHLVEPVKLLLVEIKCLMTLLSQCGHYDKRQVEMFSVLAAHLTAYGKFLLVQVVGVGCR